MISALLPSNVCKGLQPEINADRALCPAREFVNQAINIGGNC